MRILSKQENVIFDGTTSEAIVRKRTNNKLRSPFSAVSALTNKKRVSIMMKEDVFDLLDQVSKGAFSVFNNLKYNRSETDNTTQFAEDAEMTRTQKETLSRKLKELRAVGLIRMVKGEIQDRDTLKVFTLPKGTFIINPDMIRCTDHDGAEYLWNQCELRESNNG